MSGIQRSLSQGMLANYQILLLSFISFFAFFLKGIIGVGTATIIVAFGSLILPSKDIVVLVSFLNLIAGFSMIYVDPLKLEKKFLLIVSLCMVIGSIVGALLLYVVSLEYFKIALGVMFLISSLFFIYSVFTKEPKLLDSKDISIGDVVISFISGFCGGLVGICAPPLVVYYGMYLNKRYLRRFLVIVLIPAAIAQCLMFFYLELLSVEVVKLGLYMLPSMALGIFVGNKTHFSLSEKNFKILLAIFLFVISLKTLL